MKLSATELRNSANNWRTAVGAIVGIGLLASFVMAIGAAQVINSFSGGNNFSLGAFLAFFLALGVPIGGFSLPYFIMTQTMDGLAGALDTLGTAQSKLRRPPRISLAPAATLPASPKPTYDGEPSVKVRRVAGAVGAIGEATRDAVADKLGMNPEEVAEALEELQARKMVEKLSNGRFRYTDPSERKPEPKMLYCITCRYPVSESLITGPHAGHKIRR